MTQLIEIIMTTFGLLVFMVWYFRREIVRERKREDELKEMAYIAYVTGWVDGSNDADTDFFAGIFWNHGTF